MALSNMSFPEISYHSEQLRNQIKVKNGNKIVEIWDGTKVVVPSTT